MIGGHEEPTSGDIVLDGQSLLGLPPDKRPTTTVFQHFALFPHRSVRENVEFGPKMRGDEQGGAREKAMTALEMVGLQEMADRRPSALSGGQQQRVALARVLVMEPKALLLDEPLGDLDRLLRLRMRVELRSLQRQLGLMFIHVTHDQEEALSVGDRIVVMHEGRIEQVADPYTISNRRENVQVAAFMGDNNIFEGTVSSQEGDRVVIYGGDATLSALDPESELEVGGRRRQLSVRAAAVQVDDQDARGGRAEPAPGRDRGRRVPGRPGEAPSVGRRTTPAREGRRATATPSSKGGKEPACACPGRRRMSGSSEPEGRPGLRVEEIAEAEQAVGELAPEEVGAR